MHTYLLTVLFCCDTLICQFSNNLVAKRGEVHFLVNILHLFSHIFIFFLSCSSAKKLKFDNIWCNQWKWVTCWQYSIWFFSINYSSIKNVTFWSKLHHNGTFGSRYEQFFDVRKQCKTKETVTCFRIYFKIKIDISNIRFIPLNHVIYFLKS